ncbi:hypothetical protein [Mesorhizobium sp. CAU 1741]|uniref:hypothetical protein n=1 Tax=Mesorhizobium sp. CAU 1741 TaxID=3140366 RepID=UPI00325B3F1E
MGYFRQKSWSLGFALVAAYMLVLQAMLGAFAMGAASASPMLDVFGNPLCITSQDTAAQSDGDRDHGALPDCCGSACSMFAPLTVEDRTPHSLPNPLPFALHVEFSSDATVVLSAPDHDPGNPRAPPVTL